MFLLYTILSLTANEHLHSIAQQAHSPCTSTVTTSILLHRKKAVNQRLVRLLCARKRSHAIAIDRCLEHVIKSNIHLRFVNLHDLQQELDCQPHPKRVREMQKNVTRSAVCSD